MEKLLKQFKIIGKPVSITPFGGGHINSTFKVVTDAPHEYILQRINNKIFQNVEGLMGNIDKVTKYLRANDPDPRHVLTMIDTLDGKNYIRTENDEYWRVEEMITDAVALSSGTAEDFRQSGIGFGMFQKALSGFPADTLVETIPMFHNTVNRYKQLDEAIRNDNMGRAKNVQADIDFYLARREDAALMVTMQEKGELPLRVTHNDTKLDNVMLDAKTRKPLCVLDLDTVMPGLAGNDFGDSIRFGASTGLEDEKDLEKVWLSLELYDAYADGFLGTCGQSLTKLERETLPDAAKLMTLECGSRFLADYLNGDVYFHTDYAEHNLVRARTQAKLVAENEKKRLEIEKIIAKY